MKPRKLFLLFPFLLVFAGCVPKVDKKEPIDSDAVAKEVLRDIDGTAFAERNVTQAWWEAFGDAQLDALIAKVRRTAPSVKALQARFEHAKNVLSSVRSTELPTVAAGGSLTRERLSENYIFPAPLGGSTNTEYDVWLGLDYTFDFWDKRASLIKAARYDAVAKNVQVAQSRLLLSSSICGLYVEWDYEEQLLEMLRERYDLLSQEQALLQSRFESGLADRYALNAEAAQMARVREQMQSAERAIEDIHSGIGVLGGLMPSEVEKLHAPSLAAKATLNAPKSVYAELISQRPDIVMQKYIVLGRSERIEAAKAAFYPNIDLAALVGYTSFSLQKFLDASSFAPSAGIAASLPLFDNGAREAYLHMQTDDYNAEVYRYNQTVIRAVNETVGCLKKIGIVAKEQAILAERIVKEEENTGIAQGKFDAGLQSIQPLIQARLAVLQSRMDQAQLRTQDRMLKIALVQSVGGGYAPTQGAGDGR